MVIESARLAAAQLLDRKFRLVLGKSIGLTLLIFIGVWIAMESLFTAYAVPQLAGWPWLATAALWLMGAGILVGSGFLLAPVAAMVAGLFLDEAAEHTERAHYTDDPVGEPLPVVKSIGLTMRFTFLVVFANLIALLLVLLPGINVAIFFLLNGYLLGREYFMFAAMRFKSEEEAGLLRQNHSTTVLLAGLVIAGFMAVPILNLATPVFAASMMVHIHKYLSDKTPPPA